MSQVGRRDGNSRQSHEVTCRGNDEGGSKFNSRSWGATFGLYFPCKHWGQSDTTKELLTEALSHAPHLGGNQVAPLSPPPHLGISRVALVRWRIFFLLLWKHSFLLLRLPLFRPLLEDLFVTWGEGAILLLFTAGAPLLSLCRQRMDGPPGIRTCLKGAA